MAQTKKILLSDTIRVPEISLGRKSLVSKRLPPRAYLLPPLFMKTLISMQSDGLRTAQLNAYRNQAAYERLVRNYCRKKI